MPRLHAKAVITLDKNHREAPLQISEQKLQNNTIVAIVDVKFLCTRELDDSIALVLTLPRPHPSVNG